MHVLATFFVLPPKKLHTTNKTTLEIDLQPINIPSFARAFAPLSLLPGWFLAPTWRLEAEYIDHSKHDPEKVVEVSPNGRYAKVTMGERQNEFSGTVFLFFSMVFSVLSAKGKGRTTSALKKKRQTRRCVEDAVKESKKMGT